VQPIRNAYWASTPPLNPDKAVVVTSGGIDSITSAYVAAKVHGKQVTLVHFNYGQRSEEREEAAVREIAMHHLGVPYRILDLRLLGDLGQSPLTDRSIELPLGMESVESTLCWVPARNMLMVSYAAAVAEAEGAAWIYYGNNMEEEATGYGDNDLDFISIFNDLLEYGTLRGVQIRQALCRLMKPELLHVGHHLGVPYHLTWSCDEGFDKPCGICGCCTTRRYAFKRAGLTDEQMYREPLRDVYPWEGAKKYDPKDLLSRVT